VADADPPVTLCPSCGGPPGGTWRCGRCSALVRTGDLRVEELLSLTPRGRVYRGHLGEQAVAVKELVFSAEPDPATLDLFREEAERLSRLDHPSVPRVIHAFTEGDGDEERLYLVWQLVVGESLDKRVADHRFEEPEAKKIAADVLDALGYLHTRQPKVLHRDLKPANVILRPDGGHSIVDLGFPQELEDEPQINAAYGYRAPEHVIGDPDERSDLYSLGMTLAHLLSRRDVADLYGTDVTVVFRPYVNASAGFLDFVDGLVARSREGRFSSAARALKALRGLGGGTSDRALGASGPAPSTRIAPAEVVQFRVYRREADITTGSGPQVTGKIVWVQSSRVMSDATPSGRPWCAVLGGKRLGLRPGFAYLVGRGDDADIRVEDDWEGADTVSRKHVTLTVNRTGLMVREMGSVNGTVVGQMTLPKGSGTMQVRDPAKLRLGRFVIRVFPWTGEET